MKSISELNKEKDQGHTSQEWKGNHYVADWWAWCLQEGSADPLLRGYQCAVALLFISSFECA
jgi:hypothetical protein